MRWTLLLLLPVLGGAVEIGGSNVRTVYLMPMAHGLDQFLASRLTREHVFAVVADPALADGVLTEQLGEALVAELEKLHPTAKPEEDEAEADSKEADTVDKIQEKEKEKGSDVEALAKPRTFTNAEIPQSTFGRGKGTLFLVDAHSRAILWSVYEPPKRFSSDELDRTAKRVVVRLKQDLAGK